MSEIITFKHKGNFKKTYSFFEKALEIGKLGFLDRYGREGVEDLSAGSPKDTGLLSKSWYYKIERDGKNVVLRWCNSDIEGGQSVAVLLQYGHATKGGKWVEGIDFVNPAIRPIMNRIADEAAKELSKL